MDDRPLHGYSFQRGNLSEGTPGAGGSLAGQTRFADPVATDEVPDPVLVARAKDGDEAAFQALYARHRAAVTRVCRRWLVDEQLAEDAVQESFLKAWSALESFQGGERFGRWVRRIAKNHCHSVWRSWHRRGFELTGDAVIDLVDPAPTPDNVDAIAVRRMLASLEPRDAALLVERHIGDLSVATLASRWGLTSGAMDVALHRARVRARRLATAEGLRSLLPMPLLRRAAAALQRFGASCSEAVAAVAEVAAPVLIAAGLALPAMGMARAEASAQPASSNITASQDADSRSDSARLRDAALASRGVVQPPQHRSPRQDVRGRRTQRPDSPRTQRHWSHSPVEFEPVAVPATDREVRTTPPAGEQRSHTIGVQMTTAVHEETLEVETYEGDELDTVAEAACPVADSAQPVTYCTP